MSGFVRFSSFYSFRFGVVLEIPEQTVFFYILFNPELYARYRVIKFLNPLTGRSEICQSPPPPAAAQMGLTASFCNIISFKRCCSEGMRFSLCKICNVRDSWFWKTAYLRSFPAFQSLFYLNILVQRVAIPFVPVFQLLFSFECRYHIFFSSNYKPHSLFN